MSLSGGILLEFTLDVQQVILIPDPYYWNDPLETLLSDIQDNVVLVNKKIAKSLTN